MLQQLYQNRITNGIIKSDYAQAGAIAMLDRLRGMLGPYHMQLMEYRKTVEEIKQIESNQRLSQTPKENEKLIEFPPHPRKPRGVYLHGHVGTGKTMLMDMFYQSVEIQSKKRVHLHDFMIDVHQKIHNWKKFQRAEYEKELQIKYQVHQLDDTSKMEIKRKISKESDGITHVARSFAMENTLIAFDEFVVVDVVDALILKHLFTEMFLNGVVVVATSNTKPDDLYKDGLNYPYFSPFIPLLKSHCKTFDMDSSVDYRLQICKDESQPNYFTPLNQDTKRKIDTMFDTLTGGVDPVMETVQVAFGRKLLVKKAMNGVCRFDFEELCGDFEPVMGSADFQALCEHFHTIVIENVPKLGRSSHNATRRFVTLIDQVYDNNVKLVISAEAPPSELFDNDVVSELCGDLLSVKDLGLASKRMVSRLTEMCTI